MLSVVVGLVGGLANYALIAHGLVPATEWLYGLLVQQDRWARVSSLVVNILLPGAVFACTLFIPAAGGLYMARCCQHRWAVFLSGQLLGAFLWAGHWLGSTAMPTSRIISSGSSEWFHVPYAVLAGTCLGLIDLAVCFVYARFISALKQQDGTLCVACGYDVSRSPSDSCSECGTRRDTPMRPFGRIYRAADFLDRHASRAAVAAVLLVCLIIGGYIFLQWPFWRFARAFESQSLEIWPTPSIYTDYRTASFAVLPLSDDPLKRLLCVIYYRSGLLEQPAMIASLGSAIPAPWPTGAATSSIFIEGAPSVTCNLDAEQARRVIDQGMPAPLIRAFLEAADAAGWTPGVWPGRKTQSVVVPAAEHFQ